MKARIPMTHPTRSRCYRYAQWRLSCPSTSARTTVLWALLGLSWLTSAMVDERLRILNLIGGVMMLCAAWSDWELRGFREIIEEQKQRVGLARSSND